MSALRAWWHGLIHFHRIAVVVQEYDLHPGERTRYRWRFCYDCNREFGRERVA